MVTKKINLINRIKDDQIIKSLNKLFDCFINSNNKELYLVGGSVRDLLLEKAPKDYDLTTNIEIDEIKELVSHIGFKTFMTGLKHDTITVVDEENKLSFEITKYRDIDFEHDLIKRDFTINSFAYNFLTQELLMIDESYLKDLEYGIIRSNDPIERFKEDPLRMLRAIRFGALLNFSIEKNTYDSIARLNSLIETVSKERIRDELTKILLSDYPENLLLIVTSSLETYLFNGDLPISDMALCEHQNPWHYTDVFHHTVDVIKRVPKEFELRWAAFFHDLGKKECKALKVGKIDHYTYYGHPDVSLSKAKKIMNLLKFSNKQKSLISRYIKYHDVDLVGCRNITFKRIVIEIGPNHFLDYMKLRYADAFAHNLIRSTIFSIDNIDIAYNRFKKLMDSKEPLLISDLVIDGKDLLDLGLSGKEIGETLHYLLEQVLEKHQLNNKESLLQLVKKRSK